MGRRFAISDIHGCFNTFKRLLEKISFTKDDELYLLGDYIDRGLYSRHVIDFILHLRQNSYKVYALRGNHEQMLLDCYFDQAPERWWLNNGGTQTLSSYGVRSVKDLFTSHLVFFESLPLYFVTPDFLLVHAGFDFNEDNIFGNKEAMIWIRRFEVDGGKTEGRVVVHGHSPAALDIIQESIVNVKRDLVIPIDNGCVFGKTSLTGNLIALELNSLDITVQENIDK